MNGIDVSVNMNSNTHKIYRNQKKRWFTKSKIIENTALSVGVVHPFTYFVPCSHLFKLNIAKRISHIEGTILPGEIVNYFFISKVSRMSSISLHVNRQQVSLIASQEIVSGWTVKCHQLDITIYFTLNYSFFFSDCLIVKQWDSWKKKYWDIII